MSLNGLYSMALPAVVANLRRRRKSPLRRELLQLTIPIFIETLLIMSLGAVDTLMLSRHSDASVAAVGLANQLLSFCFIIFEVINLGTAVLCSQYIGAGLIEKMRTVVGVSLVVNLIFGLLVSLSLWLFATPILIAMGLEGEMLEEGVAYLEMVGGFAFVQAIALTLSAALRANNRPIFPMMVILVVNILNIFGDYVLIFGKFGAPVLGVSGAALSTAIARVASMSILFVITFRTIMDRFPWHILRKWPRQEFRNLMKIGLPSAGEQFSYSCSQLVIAYFIATLGMESLAARTYCVNIIMFVYLFSIAVSHAGAIQIGHLVGARHWEGAYTMGRYVMRVATFWTLAISTVTAFSGNQIMTFLTDNPEIIALGTAILRIDLVLEIGRPINIVFVNILQASGDVNYPFYVGLVVMWSVAVGCAYLFGIVAGFGILGMWWMFALDENIRGIVFIRRWNSRRWQNKAFTT